jgi:hypothetical protein
MYRQGENGLFYVTYAFPVREAPERGAVQDRERRSACGPDNSTARPAPGRTAASRAPASRTAARALERTCRGVSRAPLDGLNVIRGSTRRGVR